MTLAEFSAVGRGERARLLALAGAAGVTNTLALLLVNRVAQAPASADLWAFAGFAAAATAHIAAARATSHRINAVVEATLHRIKARVVEQVERADLGRLERVGTAEIYDRLTENMSVISTASSAVGVVLQGASIFVFGLVYMAWLSLAAFAVVVPLMLGALTLYRARVRGAHVLLREYNAARVQFLDLLTGLIHGAKEIKLSRARSAAVRADFVRRSARLRDVSTRFAGVFDDGTLFLSCNLYLLLAALVFVLPVWVEVPAEMLAMVLAAVLFVWGSMEAALAGYPMYVQARLAIGEIAALERKLAVVAPREPADGGGDEPWSTPPGELALAEVEYVYPAVGDEPPFRIGPIDLTIARGETVFIVGGNGSGKTTLLKVLTGLYAPSRGSLRCGGLRVVPGNAPGYRETISPIFADFHLFSRAYGMQDVEPAAVDPLLAQMQLADKTAFRGGRFTRRDLSTGQRKRLALVLTLLEDRPVMVFDEWAADQDPEFRRYFYAELLPALKRRGKTVIAVSHDDRYFGCADRVVFMEYGAIRAIEDRRAR